MKRTMMKSKIHRATVTGADLDYEGSIAIDPILCEAADLLQFERVEIYNVNNGARLATYVIYGQRGEICLNGAAARMAHRGDKVIIASYADMEDEECRKLKPKVVFVDDENKMTGLKAQ
ncbi:MAG: aspartate 1-decarboxylase [Bdellovibrionales bacterium]|nr:aspartate 1-decarboxylase [Bdellovibrionales bacterium]